MALDMRISVQFPTVSWSHKQGLDEFVVLLASLSKARVFDRNWFVAKPVDDGDTSGFDPVAEPEQMMDWFSQRLMVVHPGSVNHMGFDAYAEQNNPTSRFAEVQMGWAGRHTGFSLCLDFWSVHQKFGLSIKNTD